jgi:hypothetical protein
MAAKKLISVLLLAVAINIVVAGTISVYVSDSTGSDSTGDGSMESPFKTIGKAKDHVRTLDKTDGDSIFVEIGAGTYTLTESLMFDVQDSGTAGSPITYRAMDGEEVIIIGGATIGGWAAVTDNAILDRLKPDAKTSVRVASLGSLDMGILVRRGLFVPGGYAAMELFYKNEPMTLARYPNTGFMTISSLDTLTFTFTPAENNVELWMQESDPQAMGYWQFNWAEEYTAVTQFQDLDSSVSGTIGITPVFGIVSGSRFYLLNMLCELDSPGEFYIDRDNAKIYFWPPGELSDPADIVVSVLDYVIKMEETSYVTFEGLTLEASRKEGVYATHAQNVTLRNLVVRNTGTNSISISASSNVLLEYCTLENAGDTAVYLQGGDRNTLTRSNIVARSNVVRKFARWSKTYNPAFKVDGVGVTIEHNDIYNAPHTALWWFGNYHTFQYNKVHDVCKETRRRGIYTGRDWTFRGNVIKHNLFYDIVGFNGEGAVGVYFDDQYSSGEIYGNIFFNLTTGILIGGGRDNSVKNNMFIGSNYGLYMDARGIGACGPQNNQSLYDTLLTVPYTSEVWANAFPELASILDGNPNVPENNSVGSNVFVDTNTPVFLCTEPFFEGLLTVTEDCELTMEDFEDASALNFNFKAGAKDKCATAFKTAFQDIPLDMIGLLPPPEVPMAPTSSPASSPSGSSPSGNNGPTSKPVSTASTSAVYGYFLLVLPLLF